MAQDLVVGQAYRPCARFISAASMLQQYRARNAAHLIPSSSNEKTTDNHRREQISRNGNFVESAFSLRAPPVERPTLCNVRRLRR